MKNPSAAEDILEIEGLNLMFNMRFHHERSARDMFVNVIKEPLQTFLRPRDTLHVLKDVNLRLRNGDRLGVVGVNGSGKTSLCRCIAGMLRPVSGSVMTHGLCRAIFSTQVGVLPELTARENARVLARLMYPGSSKSVIRELADEAMEFSELGEFLDAPFETLSLGMKARLCLSVITAKSCDLLVLDEVYDSTDQFFQTKMTARLRTFIENSGAVIFVSHSRGQIEQICNRLVVLHNSKIAFDGDIAQGFEAYALLAGGG